MGLLSALDITLSVTAGDAHGDRTGTEIGPVQAAAVPVRRSNPSILNDTHKSRYHIHGTFCYMSLQLA